MRALTTIFILMCLIVPALAGKDDNHAIEETGSKACTGVSHAHQYSDLRIAAVEVSKVDECGFSFADLEQQTVGLDNHLDFSSDFRVLQIDKGDQGSQIMQTLEMNKKVFKRGIRGVAAYCSACKTVFTFRPFAPGEVTTTYASNR